MLCILYVMAVGALLGVAALLLERVLPGGAPRRWLWGTVILASVILPGVYRARHTWSLTESGPHTSQLSMDHAHGTGAMAAFDPGMWGRIEALNPAIGRAWYVASCILLVWGLANALRIVRLTRVAGAASVRPRGTAVLDGVPVVITDAAGPATVGVWRPRVLVPRWVLALPPVQQRYVLRHEEEHRLAHDARLLFVASLPLVLMPWNLALWWQLRRLCLAVEMDCDARVVSALGDARAYGALLLRVAEAANRGPRLQPAFIGGGGTLERRLTGLLVPEPPRHGQRFLLPMLALILLFIVVVMPHPILRPDPRPLMAATPATTSPTGTRTR